MIVFPFLLLLSFSFFLITTFLFTLDMLRVYSILYLQQVWERPASPVVVQQQILNDAAENQDIFIDNRQNGSEIIAAAAINEEG
jgi:hypothetical protein